MPRVNEYVLKYIMDNEYSDGYGGRTTNINKAATYNENTIEPFRDNSGLRPEITFLRIEKDGKLTNIR